MGSKKTESGKWQEVQTKLPNEQYNSLKQAVNLMNRYGYYENTFDFVLREKLKVSEANIAGLKPYLKQKNIKKLKMRRVIILLVITFISIVTLTSCNKTPLEKVAEYIEQNHPKIIKLSDYTNFKWDEVWIISGSIGGKYILLMREQNIDVKKVETSPNSRYGIDKDYFKTIVYIYNKKVVYYEFPPDGRGNSLFDDIEAIWTRADFDLERGQIVVVSSNNSVCEVKHRTLVPIKPIKIYENMDEKLK